MYKEIVAMLLVLILWPFVDSLAQTTELNDTALARVYMEKSMSLKDLARHDSSVWYATKAGEIYETVEDWKNYLYSQNQISDNFWRFGKYDEAIEMLTAVDSIMKDKKMEDVGIMGDTYHILGKIYYTQGQPEKALGLYKQSLPLLKKAYGAEDSEVGINYVNMASIYFYRGEYDKAQKLTENALPIFFKEDNKRMILSCYATLGNIFFSAKSDYDKAKEYYEKLLKLGLELYGKEHPLVAFGYSSLGVYHSIKKEYQLSIKNFEKGLDIFEELYGKEHHQVAEANLNIGLAHYDLGNFDNALNFYNKAYSIYQKSFPPEHPSIGRYLISSGMAYKGKKEYKKSLTNYQRALKIYRKNFKEEHPDFVRAYYETADVFRQQKKYDESLKYYQKAIAALSIEIDTNDVYDNPNIEDAVLFLYELELILHNKAACLQEKYENKSKELKDLEQALSTYLLSIELIDNMKKSYSRESSKQHWQEEAVPIYEKGIKVALQLYEQTKDKAYQEKAFALAQKSKAVLLLEAIRDMQAKEYAHIPIDTIHYEQELKNDMMFFERKIQEAQTKNDSTGITYQDSLFYLRETYEDFIKRLEKNYPKYYSLKYDLKTASIADVQQYLQENNLVKKENWWSKEQKTEGLLLEYFVADSIIYTFAITTNDYKVYQTPKSNQFLEQIYKLRKGLTDIAFIKDSVSIADDLYLNNAQRLYEQLLAKPLEDLNTKKEIDRIVIIPDGTLGYIPYDILLSEKVKPQQSFSYQQLPYLLKDYQISYAYSSTLLTNEQAQHLKDAISVTYGGFAPSYNVGALNEIDSLDKAIYDPNKTLDYALRGTAADLPNARKEVKNIAALMGGDAWTDEEATEERFKEMANQYGILHLSMHGILDDRNPLYSKLIFTQNKDTLDDDFLTAGELYNMQLNAGLAVLSACNTGVGAMRRGEGMISLSRGFAYAGCPSMLMSLWRVDDRSTSEIMLHFYETLKKGKSKDEALRSAKLHYLSNNDDPLYAHPFFWSAFVLIGNAEAIAFIEDNKWFQRLKWPLGIAFLFLLACILFYQIRKKRLGEK